MGLDLVLDRPDAHWLATEREKIDFFVDKAFVPGAVAAGEDLQVERLWRAHGTLLRREVSGLDNL